MTKPSRQALIDGISRKVAALRKEHAALQDRLRVVALMLADYEQWLAPANGEVGGGRGRGGRSQARQHRKAAMVAYLQQRGQASTAEIVALVKEQLPGASRAQVTDVLRFEPEFVRAGTRGIWRLRRPEDPNGMACKEDDG